MDGHDEEARRWAPPERRGDSAERPDAAATAPAEEPPHSAASPWTRDVRPARNRTDASATASDLRPPDLPWVAPPATEGGERREKSMLPIAIGIALLAALAWVPHWVAPTVSVMIALVGVPIAWGFRRISRGRRRVQYIVVVLTLLLVVAMSVIAPITWLGLGVLEPLTVPD